MARQPWYLRLWAGSKQEDADAHTDVEPQKQPERHKPVEERPVMYKWVSEVELERQAAGSAVRYVSHGYSEPRQSVKPVVKSIALGQSGSPQPVEPVATPIALGHSAEASPPEATSAEEPAVARHLDPVRVTIGATHSALIKCPEFHSNDFGRFETDTVSRNKMAKLFECVRGAMESDKENLIML